MNVAAAGGRRDRPPETPWVESDRLEAHLAAAGACEAHARAARELARDGFAVLDFDTDVSSLCDAAVAELAPIFADPAVTRIQNAWTVSSAVARLAALEEVSGFLSLAYGRAAFPFQTLNFERGSQQSAHADTLHFHCVPERFMCGVWLALEDVAEDAGPLVYYPGSHRLPVLSMRDAGVAAARPTYADYERAYPEAIARLIAENGLTPARALLKKGQALVWAANLLHGGAAIARAGAPRRSLVTHYYFEGCVYFTPMYSDVEAGRLHLRLPADIRTGRWRWPMRGKTPLWPGFL